MSSESVRIVCGDGFPLAADWRESASPSHGCVLIAPALGIPRSFYAEMARFLAGGGFSALTIDYRGVGGSVRGPVAGRDMRFVDWGRQDIDAALGWLQDRGEGPLYLLGHSAGGQLFGLAPRSRHLAGAVIVSSLVPWWRYFPLRTGLPLRFAQRALLPAFCLGRDRFPARLLRISSVDVAAGVVRQWAAFGLRRDYFFRPGEGHDLAGYHRLAIPLLVTHIDDDHYAPLAAIEALLRHFPRCAPALWHLASREAPGGRIGHVNFFRDRMRGVFWGHVLEWLRRGGAAAG